MEIQALKDQVCVKADVRGFHKRLISKLDIKLHTYHRASPHFQRKQKSLDLPSNFLVELLSNASMIQVLESNIEKSF